LPAEKDRAHVRQRGIEAQWRERNRPGSPSRRAEAKTEQPAQTKAHAVIYRALRF
jgi:hypothetical protein